jgi:hypothetical protein
MDWENTTRERIQSSKISNQLISHVLGHSKLEPSQVTAGLGLLKKVLPDLANVTHSGDKDNPLQLTVLTGVPRARGN